MYRFARRQTNGNAITILGARENNLKQIDVSFPAGRDDGGDRSLGLGQIDAGERHPVSRAGESDLRLARRSGRAQEHRGHRVHRQGHSHRPVADWAHAALESGDLHRRVHADSRPVCHAAGVARAWLQGGTLLVQRGGRTLRSLPGRWAAAHRNELPARRVRAVRSLRRQALQPRDAGGEVQGLLDRRPAGDAGGRRVAGAGEHSADQAEAADAGGRGAGLHSPGAVGGDAVRAARRSASSWRAS